MIKTFFKCISIQILLSISNVILGFFVYGHLPSGAGDTLFNGFRLFLFFWAGFRVTSSQIGGIRFAGIAGATILFIDHVILNGGMFLVWGLFDVTSSELAIKSFAGVLLSYVMFVLVAIIVGAIGGYLGRWNVNRRKQITT